MIIGESLNTDALPSIPCGVRKYMEEYFSFGIGATSVSQGGPIYSSVLATEWLSTRYVSPHTDDDFVTSIFLTLVLFSEHTMGGAWIKKRYHSDPPEIVLRRGDFMLIDPLKMHWLHPTNFGVNHYRTPRWWGYQWTIDCTEESWQNDISQIIADMGGQVTSDPVALDEFYSSVATEEES